MTPLAEILQSFAALIPGGTTGLPTEPVAAICVFCRGTGRVTDPDPQNARLRLPSRPCPCALGDAWRDRAVQAAGLPGSFSDFDFATYRARVTYVRASAREVGQHAVAAEWAQQLAEAGEPVSGYFWGERGRGKSFLAVAIARAWIRRHDLQTRFWTVPDLLALLRQRFEPHDGQPDSAYLMHWLSSELPLLVLDDLAAEHIASGWPAETLLRIVGGRGYAGLPTLFTSNVDLDGLAEHLGGETVGARIASRIREACDGTPPRIWRIQGVDLRVRARGEE